MNNTDEFTPLVFHNQAGINLYHQRHSNRQLARLERTTSLGFLANQEAIATAQYAVKKLDQELTRLGHSLAGNSSLTPRQHIRLHQLTITCMARLGQNAVWLDERLKEILLR